MNKRFNPTFLAIFIISLVGSGCEPAPDTTTRILEDEGYENINLTGYEFAACSKDDNFNTGFTATRRLSNGKVRHVSGVVCCGLFKDCTVRH